MMRQLPPLNGLRAFEAAARHLSFTQAAEELFVTQAAISHQVKGLEEILGEPLFRRVNRGLILSEAGQTLFPAVRDGLDTMATAVRQLSDNSRQGMLTVSTLDSIASAWLVPRLGNFRERHPDLDVRLTMGDALVDFARDEVDLAIRYGRGDWPGCQIQFLMNEEIFPVASPQLIADGPSIEHPRDLANYTLLHDTLPEDWGDWFRANDAGGVKPRGSIQIEHSHIIVQAAMAGQGIALGRSVLVRDALATGRLVRLFDTAMRVDYAYYVVGAAATWDNPRIKAMRDWLADEAALTQQDKEINFSYEPE
jgi:LysR family transcriptional regulator, glycine cleavage system transcriptional activator